MYDWLIDPPPEPHNPPDNDPLPYIIGTSLAYGEEEPGYAGERLGWGDDERNRESFIILGGDGENVEVSEAGLSAAYGASFRSSWSQFVQQSNKVVR